MKNGMIMTTMTFVFALFIAALQAPALDESKPVEKKPEPRIQMAILLDTSSSMDGLIDQAKSQLWKIVNEFVTMKRDGRPPVLEVALYEYGKSELPSEESFLRMILPLTTDLDKVSQELFALTTNGGDEYCGTVIEQAVQKLQWSKNPEDLKTIFIAGNEPFTQGSVDYRASCKAAIAHGVMVNTIFCGPHQQGIDTQWKDGALLADGSYISIDQNMVVEHIAAPQDKAIAELGEALNETYIPFGAAGAAGVSNQEAQDSNASSWGRGSMVQRAKTKASGQYSNTAWDLVDAVEQETVKIEDVETEELPEVMQKMSVEDRKKFVVTQLGERKRIQKKIMDLDKERSKFVAEKRKEKAETAESTFDEAVIESIQRMAEKQNFKNETDESK